MYRPGGQTDSRDRDELATFRSSLVWQTRRVALKGSEDSQRLRRARRNGRVLVAWTGFVCSSVPMVWWFAQRRSIVTASKAGPVDASPFWPSALACLVTTALLWLAGSYLIRGYLANRDSNQALVADLRRAVRRQDP